MVHEELCLRSVIAKHFPGRTIARIEQNKAGLMHLNYVVEFNDSGKVFYRGYSAEGPAANKRDIYFGEPLSLEREVAIMELLRKTEVRVPDVYALEDGPLGQYALLSFLEGIHFRQFLDERGHQIGVFLDALHKIGRTLASTHRVTFDHFGSIQPSGIGGARQNFADRLYDILVRHESDSRIRCQFTDDEWSELKNHIDANLESIRKRCINLKPQIVICDLHVRNFNVYPDGERAGDICGAFDVEFAQAAPASLEWGFMNVGVFPLYGEKWFRSAKDAFLKGYHEGGGDATENPALEEGYLINHALSAVGFYSGMHDGVRDGWSSAFKQWSLDIARGVYDPAMVVELTRPLHKTPRID